MPATVLRCQPLKFTFLSVMIASLNSNLVASAQSLDLISLDTYLDLIPDEPLRNLTQQLLRFCLDTDVCGYTINSSNVRGCCWWSECSCDVDCHVTQSCCPHVLHQLPTHNATSGHVVDKTCKLAAILNRLERVVGDDYHFVTSCPLYTEPLMKEACEKKVYNETFTFGDVTPVSDTRTPINYFNRHCAACNNVPVDNLVTWTPNIFCEYFPYDAVEWSSMEDVVLRHEQCVLTFDPPPDVDLNSTKCYSLIISECNITGKWTQYDQKLESACQQYPLRFEMSNHVYANAFCAMCNGEWCDGSKITLDPMIQLLAYISSPDQEDAVGQDICPPGELFDPISGGCRRLHCTKPLLLDPHEHVCRDVVQYVTEASYFIPLKVSIPHEFKINLNYADVLGWVVMWEIISEEVDTVCHLRLYFKLQHTYTQPKTTGSIIKSKYVDAQITEVFVTVLVDDSFNDHPSDTFQDIVNRLTHTPFFSDVLNVELNISYRNFDAEIQSPRTPNFEYAHKWQPPTVWSWESNVNQKPVTVFKDLYDNTSTVGPLTYPSATNCHVDSALYDIGYMDCPAFMFDVGEHGLARAPTGLLFKGHEEFEFGQFQSINDSHVLICSDIVRDRVTSSQGYYKCPLFIQVIVFIAKRAVYD